MKIDCLHGFFIFQETKSGQVSDFMNLFGLSLVRYENHFTFEKLADAPEFSIAGLPYLGAAAIKSFSGKPWEIMRANKLIYDFNDDTVKQIDTVKQNLALQDTGRYFINQGLVLPGSLTDEGDRVTEYAAWFSRDLMKFKYVEVTFD